MMTDPVADMLTRIRNALSASHDRVEFPASKTKAGICKVLKEEGFIKSFKDTKEKISKGYYDVIGASVDSEKIARYFDMLHDIRSRVEKSGKKSIIVCGGQGGAHAYKSFIKNGKADAVLAASIFHYGEFSIKQAKEFLNQKRKEKTLRRI